MKTLLAVLIVLVAGPVWANGLYSAQWVTYTNVYQDLIFSCESVPPDEQILVGSNALNDSGQTSTVNLVFLVDGTVYHLYTDAFQLFSECPATTQTTISELQENASTYFSQDPVAYARIMAL